MTVGTQAMEHRCGARLPACAAVTLVAPGGILIRGVLRDMSISGVFVETGSHRCRTFATVELRLVRLASAGLHTDRATAMVARVTAEGVGLMFDALNPPLIADLIEALSFLGTVSRRVSATFPAGPGEERQREP